MTVGARVFIFSDPDSHGKHTPFTASFKKYHFSGFLGGTVDRNPPANAEDMGLIPDPGRFHKPRSN